MFNGLVNLKEIDLSNLDFSKVTNMESMFKNCLNLSKINFGNINTSSVENMAQLFHNCTSLTSINVSNFNTSSVTNMNSMFRECNSLTSIDVSNFDTSKVEDMMDMFAFNYKLISIDVSNFDTRNVKNLRGMFFRCETLKYLDLSNFNTSLVNNTRSMFQYCSSLLYLNFNGLKMKQDEEREKNYALEFTPSNLKICINDSLTGKLLVSISNIVYNANNMNCSDICFEKNIKISLNEDRCLYNCNESYFKYEYKNYCFEKCPSQTFLPDDKEYICLEKTQEDNYYLDNQKGIYKKCYNKCKKCEIGGDEINNNCLECKEGFRFINDLIYNNNCYIICPENGKLIKEKNICIDECKNDNIYKYEYNNICYEHCPEGTSETSNKCFLNEIIEEDRNIKIFQDYIYNNDIIKNVTETKTDYIMENKNVIYQITTTENQKINKDKSISSLNLEECEKILREKYEINTTLPLIIFKIDYKSPYTLIPIIGYEIYHPINKSKLSLEECNDIQLNIPVSIDEEKLFVYDPKSDFYTDNCFPYTTDNGADIILADRKQEFQDKNLSLCEVNCEFTGYDTSSKQSTCNCVIKDKMESVSEIMNKKNLLNKNFSNNNEDVSSNIPSNIETMKCTKILFSKKGIISNSFFYVTPLSLPKKFHKKD